MVFTRIRGYSNSSAVITVSFKAQFALTAIGTHFVNAHGVRITSIDPVLTLVDIYAPGLGTVQRMESV